MKKIIMHPLYFLYAIYLIAKGYALYFAIYFFVVLIHELAHFFVAKQLGYNLNKLIIMPYGVCLNYNDNFFSENDEYKIALAGPITNIILGLITISFWWIIPELYYFTSFFCLANFIVGLFNFIPCYPLDGGRVLVNYIAKIKSRELGVKIALIFNYIISFLLLIIFVLSCCLALPNYSFLILAIFLFASTIEPKNYTSYNYLCLKVNKSKILTKGTSIKFLAISSQTPLYKIKSKLSAYKYNIIYIIFNNSKIKIITEEMLNKYMLVYGPKICFEKINLINMN